jgi:hypothetical protein
MISIHKISICERIKNQDKGQNPILNVQNGSFKKK